MTQEEDAIRLKAMVEMRAGFEEDRGGYTGEHIDFLLHIVKERDADIAKLRRALGLALGTLIKYEPPDSRVVSDEFASMASIECGLGNDEADEIIKSALSKFTKEKTLQGCIKYHLDNAERMEAENKKKPYRWNQARIDAHVKASNHFRSLIYKAI